MADPRDDGLGRSLRCTLTILRQRLRRLSPKEPKTDGCRDRLELRVAAELSQDRANVVSDRCLRKVQPDPDLPRRDSVAQEYQHLQLPGGKRA